MFDLYAKDTFREQRRAKAVSRDCPPCRQARVEADAAAAKERRATKKETFAKSLKPRLPDGARFAATYDATAVQWTGTLTVDGVTFERSGSSLNKLLHKLDDVYRTTKVTVVSAPEPPAVA
jgi:septal ring factor EnvC (AmiA/AmiB activator)